MELKYANELSLIRSIGIKNYSKGKAIFVIFEKQSGIFKNLYFR